MRSAVQRAKQYIADQLESNLKEKINESIIREEDEEIPTRVEDEEEEENLEEQLEDEENEEEEDIEEQLEDEEEEEEDIEEQLEDEEEEEEDINLESLLDEIEDEEYDEEEEDLEEQLEDEEEEEEDLEEQLEDEEEEEEEFPTESLRRKITEQRKLIKKQKSVIDHLKEAIREVNLFNKRLFYASKINNKYPLSRNQKIKVYEHFDKAKTEREIKLVYESLKTSLGSKRKGRRSLTEGSSKTIKSTLRSDKKLITESDPFKRMRELSGIIEG